MKRSFHSLITICGLAVFAYLACIVTPMKFDSIITILSKEKNCDGTYTYTIGISKKELVKRLPHYNELKPVYVASSSGWESQAAFDTTSNSYQWQYIQSDADTTDELKKLE